MRLYTKEEFEDFEAETPPEVLRSDLTHTFLQLKGLRVEDLKNFDWLDVSSEESAVRALESLYYLGAITKEGTPTLRGQEMVRLPLEPSLSRMLLASLRLGCFEEMLTLVAMMDGFNPYVRQSTHMAKQARATLVNSGGDHLSLINLFQSYCEVYPNAREEWCFQKCVSYRVMRRAQQVREQLLDYTQSRASHESGRTTPVNSPKGVEQIGKALVAGLPMNVAYRKPGETRHTTLLGDEKEEIDRRSGLYDTGGSSRVLYQNLVCAESVYLDTVTHLRPEWLSEQAEKFWALPQNALRLGAALSSDISYSTVTSNDDAAWLSAAVEISWSAHGNQPLSAGSTWEKNEEVQEEKAPQVSVKERMDLARPIETTNIGRQILKRMGGWWKQEEPSIDMESLNI